MTASEAASFAAIQARLLPSSATGPGAQEAHTIGFLDGVLAADDVSTSRKATLRQGRARADEGARWYGKQAFAELQTAQQDAILRSLERDTQQGIPWLRLMLEYTLEGFLCDPVHGGNAGEVAWRWLGHKPGVPRPTPAHVPFAGRGR